MSPSDPAAAVERSAPPRVTPSRVPEKKGLPFTLDQELEPFGRWAGEPIWAPPKDASEAMAKTMLDQTRAFTTRQKRWESVVQHHRNEFTQVREMDLFHASIRLPKGRFLVSVTEQKDFDKIEEEVPPCVKTRLEEFLAGPGKQPGVKVYYLKPLCVDFCDELILTERKHVDSAIAKVQQEVFAEYRQLAVIHRPLQAISAVVNVGLAPLRWLVHQYAERRQKAIDAYQARLEFKRRKLALGAARTHRKMRTDGCTFDEMLKLTSPLKRVAVVDQYCAEQEVSRAERRRLMRIAAGSVPWFMLLSLSISAASTLSTLGAISTVAVCDPTFVAEMPGTDGVLLKIGHFDEVSGVTHVEL